VLVKLEQQIIVYLQRNFDYKNARTHEEVLGLIIVVELLLYLSIIVCFIGFYIYLAKHYSKSHKVNYMYNVCV